MLLLKVVILFFTGYNCIQFEGHTRLTLAPTSGGTPDLALNISYTMWELDHSSTTENHL